MMLTKLDTTPTWVATTMIAEVMKMFKLDELTDEELTKLSEKIFEEKRARTRARQEGLIASFKEAWQKLETNGLWVTLTDDYYNGDTIHYRNVEIVD